MMTDKRMRRSATIRYGAGRLALTGAALAGVWTAVTLLSGGFSLRVGPIAVSSRDPLRPLLFAVVLLVLARTLWRGPAFGRALHAFSGDRDRLPARIAAAAASAVLIVSIAWNTRAAGGSDSSCYVLQAEAFARGRLALTDSLSQILPDATPAMFAPAGFVPSRIAPFAAVPICGPGLALFMSAVSFAGRDAVFLVVPAFAAVAVWVTFLIGRRVDDAVTGAMAAVLLATSPILLYQSVQPMSDVPATALWLAALALLSGSENQDWRRIAAGICASAAVLTRPNVALIVLPLLALLRDRRAFLSFAVGAIPGAAAMAWLNAARYGSSLTSGYGTTDILFSLAHIGPNLARYPRWLLETETPFVLAAVFAPWWAMGSRTRHPRLVIVLISAIVLTAATYLAYTVFDDWWYIRFLLPALPAAFILSVPVWLEPARRYPRGRVVAAIAIGTALGAWHVHVARTHRVFDLQALESRFVVTGTYVARALPPNAVVLAVQQSGSVRYYGARSTLAWDAIPPDALDRTIGELRGAGRAVFIVLEDEEVSRFRARFVTERLGRLDWPPHAEVHAPVRVQVYDVGERDRYLGGGVVATEHVR
jgi:hypothetical protein